MQFWKDSTGLYIFWKVRAPIMLWYTRPYLTGNQCMIHSGPLWPSIYAILWGTTCTHSLDCNLLLTYSFVRSCKDDVMYRSLHIIKVLHVLQGLTHFVGLLTTCQSLVDVCGGQVWLCKVWSLAISLYRALHFFVMDDLLEILQCIWR
jgi:hypothetical protein